MPRTTSPHRWTRRELDEREYYDHSKYLEKEDYYSDRWKHSTATRHRSLGRYNPRYHTEERDKANNIVPHSPHRSRSSRRNSPPADANARLGHTRKRQRSPSKDNNSTNSAKKSTKNRVKFVLNRPPPKASNRPTQSLLFAANPKLSKSQTNAEKQSKIDKPEVHQLKESYIKTAWSKYRCDYPLFAKTGVASVEVGFTQPEENKCHFGTQSRTLESAFYKELQGAKFFRKQASAKAEGLEKKVKLLEEEKENAINDYQKLKAESDEKLEKLKIENDEKLKNKNAEIENLKKRREDDAKQVKVYADRERIANKEVDTIIEEKKVLEKEYKVLEDMMIDDVDLKKQLEKEKEEKRKLEKKVAMAELEGKELVYKALDELNKEFLDVNGEALQYLSKSCFALRNAKAEVEKARKKVEEI